MHIFYKQQNKAKYQVIVAKSTNSTEETAHYPDHVFFRNEGIVTCIEKCKS